VSGEDQRKTHDFDAFGRFDRPISAILLVISFSRVVWMLEKAGVSHLIMLKHMRSVRSCTKNIAHWWIVEHC